MRNEFYKRNPGVFAHFKVDEKEQLIFEFDETQVDLPRMMFLLSEMVKNYLSQQAVQSNELKNQNKENSHGKTTKRSNRNSRSKKG